MWMQYRVSVLELEHNLNMINTWKGDFVIWHVQTFDRHYHEVVEKSV